MHNAPHRNLCHRQSVCLLTIQNRGMRGELISSPVLQPFPISPKSHRNPKSWHCIAQKWLTFFCKPQVALSKHAYSYRNTTRTFSPLLCAVSYLLPIWELMRECVMTITKGMRADMDIFKSELVLVKIPWYVNNFQSFSPCYSELICYLCDHLLHFIKHCVRAILSFVEGENSL